MVIYAIKMTSPIRYFSQNGTLKLKSHNVIIKYNLMRLSLATRRILMQISVIHGSE